MSIKIKDKKTLIVIQLNYLKFKVKFDCYMDIFLKLGNFTFIQIHRNIKFLLIFP
jgi:hypothetical protein